MPSNRLKKIHLLISSFTIISIAFIYGISPEKTASIFFDFGTEGSSDEMTYYFDDVNFGPSSLTVANLLSTIAAVYPNPTYSSWNIDFSQATDKVITIYNATGNLVREITTKDCSTSSK